MDFNTILFLRTNPLSPDQSARIDSDMALDWIKSEIDGVWTRVIPEEAVTVGSLEATTKYMLFVLDSTLLAADIGAYSYICQVGNSTPISRNSKLA